MADQIKEAPKAPERKLFSDQLGCYILVDDKKVFRFEFGSTNTLAENYDGLSLLKDAVWGALEDAKKKEAERKAADKEQIN